MEKKNELISQDGFTLIEVLIAIAILGIGILSSVAMGYIVVRGNSDSNVVNREMVLAERVIEEMKNRIDVSTLPAGIIVPLGVPVDDVGVANAGGPYIVTATVSNPFGGGGSRVLTVMVSKAGGFEGHPITIRSLTFGSGI